MKNEKAMRLRYFLKDDIRQETDFRRTSQNMGVAAPPIEKPCSTEARKIKLSGPEAWLNISDVSVAAAIAGRQSQRQFKNQPLSMTELAYLLWSTQGVREWQHQTALRTVPSAGNRHTLETYLAVFNVDGLEAGIYRYLPSLHELVLESAPAQLKEKMIAAALNQKFTAAGAVTFIWTTIPYRMEWRYAEASYKVIALDAGHVCQNLYLACQSIGAGTCAVAAYDQPKADQLLHVDGEEEFVIYMAPVGKV